MRIYKTKGAGSVKVKRTREGYEAVIEEFTNATFFYDKNGVPQQMSYQSDGENRTYINEEVKEKFTLIGVIATFEDALREAERL